MGVSKIPKSELIYIYQTSKESPKSLHPRKTDKITVKRSVTFHTVHTIKREMLAQGLPIDFPLEEELP